MHPYALPTQNCLKTDPRQTRLTTQKHFKGRNYGDTTPIRELNIATASATRNKIPIAEIVLPTLTVRKITAVSNMEA